jgi:transposase
VVAADTAHDSDAFRAQIATNGARAVTANNSSHAKKAPAQQQLYAERHLIERCFSKPKQLHGSGARHEKTA